MSKGQTSPIAPGSPGVMCLGARIQTVSCQLDFLVVAVVDDGLNGHAMFDSAIHRADLEKIVWIEINGRQVAVLASRNADEVIRRARDLSAVSVEVSPVPLREIFLETVKETPDA